MQYQKQVNTQEVMMSMVSGSGTCKDVARVYSVYFPPNLSTIAIPPIRRSPRIAQLEERSTVIVICHRKVTCSIQVSGSCIFLHFYPLDFSWHKSFVHSFSLAFW